MKAIALISGGLDSTLAAKLIKEQGIKIVGLKFKIPFFLNPKKPLLDLGIEIKKVDIGDEFLAMLKNPRHGYGRNLNPCIDCKILMLSKAKNLMEEFQAEFIITGEVLGQRPMSQNKQALVLIEKRAGLQGLILRPLSGKLLPQTIPEKEGWLKRDNLKDFNGRSRLPQIELAKELGIKEYAQPAGGCLLTDPEFTKRLKDLIIHEGLSQEDIELLKLGRHFRLSDKIKLVVGRDKKENERLLVLAEENDYLFMPNEKTAGPVSLGRGVFNDNLIEISCSITCRYCDLDGKTETEIVYRKVPDEEKILKVTPFEKEKLINLRV